MALIGCCPQNQNSSPKVDGCWTGHRWSLPNSPTGFPSNKLDQRSGGRPQVTHQADNRGRFEARSATSYTWSCRGSSGCRKTPSGSNWRPGEGSRQETSSELKPRRRDRQGRVWGRRTGLGTRGLWGKAYRAEGSGLVTGIYQGAVPKMRQRGRHGLVGEDAKLNL